MSSTIVTPSTFSASNISFSAVKNLESGGRQAYLNYKGGRLTMQVGPLETPFGLSVFDKQGPPKYSVDLKLRGYDDAANNPVSAATYNALHSLDEFMLSEAVKNSPAWFKGQKSREVLAELYTPTVKFSRDQQGNVKPYPPTIKLQLRQRDGKFETAMYDSEKRPLTDVPLEDIIVKGTVMTALIECTGVWFAGGKFGLSWKAIQIRADKVPQGIRGYGFVDGPDSSSETPAAAAPKASAPANKFAALHDDDDDEVVDDDAALSPTPAAVAPPAEEEEDEEPPTPAPKKVALPVKKKVAIPAKK